MFTLVTDRSRYYRIKRGQSASEIENVLSVPVRASYTGAIIAVPDKKLVGYTAQVGDTYRTLALRFGVGEERLKSINNGKPVYPTCKIFVPSGCGADI